MTVRAVVFDVGETLVDETAGYQTWSDWLGVPRLTLMGVLGGYIERGVPEPHLAAFRHLRPDFDADRERAAMTAAGVRFVPAVEELYPDVLPCLAALRAAGHRLGVVGNQPAAFEAFARAYLPVDMVASSAGWGVAKPAGEFFARVAVAMSLPPAQVAYVGDRVDNDVVPARAAGLRAVFLRRGPWGHLQADWPQAAAAELRLDTLAELPAGLATLPAETPPGWP